MCMEKMSKTNYSKNCELNGGMFGNAGRELFDNGEIFRHFLNENLILVLSASISNVAVWIIGN